MSSEKDTRHPISDPMGAENARLKEENARLKEALSGLADKAAHVLKAKRAHRIRHLTSSLSTGSGT